MAVVGSGPAGITVAADLAVLGHSVKMFEALHEPGGVLVYGIPEFRLPKAIVAREVNYVCTLGVELETDVVIGRTYTVDELLEEYDAVFLGTGAGLPWFMGIPGENLNGVYSANEYLTRANLMRAYDFPRLRHARPSAATAWSRWAAATWPWTRRAPRCAWEPNSPSSSTAARAPRCPPGWRKSTTPSRRASNFELLTNPVALHSTDNSGWVREVECIRMELGEPDASGRRRPVPVKDSNFRIPTDMVVISIGQSPNPLIPKTTPDLQTAKGGVIVVDPETGKTSKRGVFAGGDVATGGATVILAMGAGKLAARAIDAYLKTGEW